MSQGPSFSNARRSANHPLRGSARPSPRHQPGGSSGRDKFQDTPSPLLPPIIPSWASGLSQVDRPSGFKGLLKLGYAFPDPNMIVGSANVMGYLITWLSRRGAVFWREVSTESSMSSRATAQDWRSFLSRRLPTSPPASLPATAAQRRKAKAADYFAELVLKDMPEAVYWRGQIINNGDVPSPIAMEVLFELFEANFRVELLALDRVLMPKEWSNQSTHTARDELLRNVFFDPEGKPGGYYLIAEIPPENYGLASNNWEVRRVFVENLRLVMSSWPISRHRLPGSTQSLMEFQFVEAERDIARFYCQRFFDMFGRAAVVPHRLNAPVSVCSTS